MMHNDNIICPHCGEEIPRKSVACPHCGSDEQTGWSENTYLDGIDIGDSFDYDEAQGIEFSPSLRKKIPLWQIISGVILLLLFFAATFRSLW